MAKNSITDYDNIAANNTDIQSVDIDEGCAPSGINNAIRELMADLADVNDGTVPLASPDINGGTIDGVTIGGTTAGAGTFTAFTSNGIDDNASSTAVTLDSSGRVGIGTTDPSLNTSTYYDDLVIKNDTSGSGAGITIQSNSTNGFGAVDFRKADGSQIGKIYASSGGGQLAFETGGNERLRIDSSGNVGIGTASPSSYEASANNLVVVDSDGVAGITIVGSSAGASAIHFADGASGSESYRGYIAYSHNGDYMRFASAATECMRIDSSGNLLVNGTVYGGAGLSLAEPDNSGVFSIFSGTGTGFQMRFGNVTNGVVGSITTTTSATSYNTSSDYRLKEDMQPMTGAIERVNALNPVNFAWKSDGSRVDGFLAHEAQAVVPEAVHGTKDAMRDEEYEVTPAVLDEDGNVVTEAVIGTRSVPDYQGIDQSKLVPLLTAALQEAITKIETLETKVAALESA